MKRKVLSLCLCLLCLIGNANDGVYYTSGSLLVPVVETDISVSKEVLTITLMKGDYASVDVYYEFMNGTEAKTVKMGFEADAPYNTSAKFNRKGIHPFIKDFTVTMNEVPLKYTNGVVIKDYDSVDGTHTTNFEALDLKDWKSYGEVSDQIIPFQDGTIYNPKQKLTVNYAYAYLFEASFQPGKNIVHHTYQYHFNQTVGLDFTLPYWLTPATRWANHQIDDFTLRIIDERGNGFILVDTLFQAAPFKAKDGKCYSMQKIYNGWDFDNDSHLFASGGSTVEWHAKNFRPTSNMAINSADQMNTYISPYPYTSGMVVLDKKGNLMGRYMGHTGKNLLITQGENHEYKLVPQKKNKVVEYSAKEGQGSLSVFYPQYKSVNIRKAPNVKAAKLCTITASETSQLSYPCRGKANDTNPDDVYEWFGIQVGDEVGYVRSDLVRWIPETSK